MESLILSESRKEMYGLRESEKHGTLSEQQRNTASHLSLDTIGQLVKG